MALGNYGATDQFCCLYNAGESEQLYDIINQDENLLNIEYHCSLFGSADVTDFDLEAATLAGEPE